MPRKPRVRVSKEEIKKIKQRRKKRKSTSIYKCKKKIIPGPWTEIETKVKVDPEIWSSGITLADPETKEEKVIFGTYPDLYWWDERGWYPIYINISSYGMKPAIEKHGLDKYIAACEKALGTEENVEEYGKIVFLKVIVNNAVDESRTADHRFISFLAKTNKKNISGFAATRSRIYRVL